MKTSKLRWVRQTIVFFVIAALAIALFPFTGLKTETKAEDGLMSLPAETERYQATVSYGEDAGIPEGAYLVLTEFSEDSAEFAEAKEAIINEDNGLTEGNFGMAAFDLTIYDAYGVPVEPSAPVQVNIQMKELPEGVDAEVLEETLTVQHLDESAGEVAVETVATTDKDEAGEIVVGADTAEAEFTVDGFSTFAITWDATTYTSTQLRLRSGTNTRGQVTVYYVTEDGYTLSRPASVGANTDIASVNYPNHQEVVISSDNVAGVKTGRTYQRAYIEVDGAKKTVTRLVFTRRESGTNPWEIDYYNGETLVTSVSGPGVTSEGWRLPVYLEYSGENTNAITVHLVDDEGSELTGFTYTGSIEGVQEVINSEGSIALETLFPANGNLDLSTSFTKTGYTFSNSYLNYYKGTEPNTNNGVPIGNVLNRNGNQIRALTYPGNTTYTDLVDGDQVYLVYSPIAGSGGGGGGQGGGGDTPALGQFGNSKAVTSNNDGTYNVALTVSGSSKHKTEETKINVVFIVDCSNSMVQNQATGATGTRLENTKKAVNAMATALLANNTSGHEDAVELALTQFNNNAATIDFGTDPDTGKKIYWTTDATTFTNAVTNDLETHQGTNWEAGLQEALSVMGTGDGDPTYVVFFTDGQPTNFVGWKQPNDDTYYNQYYEWDYWPARDEARQIVYQGNVLYGIFAYNNNATYRGYLQDVVRYAYNDPQADTTYFYNASNASAVEAALEEILNTINMNFAYANVNIDDGVTGLSSTTLTGADASSLTYKITYKDYTGTGANDYTTKTITTTANADGYKLTVNSNGTLTIPAVSYHVLDKNENDETIVVSAQTSEVTITGVTFTDGDVTSGKTVAWSMKKANGDPYLLEEGWTYEIDFTVWPSQAAYDLVAALNNGVVQWGDDYTYTDTDGTTKTVKFDDYKLQVEENDHTYSMKTNTRCEVTYQQITETIDDQGHVTYDLSDPKTVTVVPNPYTRMGLESTTMNVEKAWDDSINTRNRANYVDFYLQVDGKYYHKDGTSSTTVPSDADAYIIPVTDTGKYSDGTNTYTCGDGSAWINSVYIAPGVLKTKTEGGVEVVSELLETGHKYTILEKSAHKYKRDADENPDVSTEDSYQPYTMDFTTQTVRPMEVNGHLKYLVLIDANNQPPTTPPSGATVKRLTIGTEQYYYLDFGDNVVSTVGLTATNHKTAELDITKAINGSLSNKTDAQLNEEKFTYEVTFVVPDGTAAQDIAGIKYWIYKPATDEADQWTLPEYGVNPVTGYQPYGYTTELKYTGDQATSHDTTASGITVTATVTISRDQVIRFTNLPKGTTYTIVETKANGQTLDAQGYTIESVKFTDPDGSANDAKNTITGTIAAYNTRYYNQFTNKLEAVDAELKAAKALDGYTWSQGDESYEFTLTATGNAPLPSINAQPNNKVTVTSTSETPSFGRIRYTAEGTYVYTITETVPNPANPAIDYATGPATVTVTVGKQDGKFVVTGITGTGTRTATAFTAASENGVANAVTTFTNKFLGYDLTVKKTFTGVNALPTNYQITVSYTDVSGQETSVVLTTGANNTYDASTHTYTWTVEDVLPYEVTAVESNYTLTGYTVTPSATLTGATVTENTGTSVKFTMPSSDGTVVAFTNAYTPDLTVTKTFTGLAEAKIPADYKITVNYTDGSGTTQQAQLTIANATKTQGSLTYTWTVANVLPNTTVTAAEDENHIDVSYYVRTSTAAVTGAEPTTNTGTSVVFTMPNSAGTTAAFTNTYVYTPEPTTAKIYVKKVLAGAPNKFVGSIQGAYTFTLVAGSNNAGVTTPMPTTTSYTNPDRDGGMVTFGDITFTKGGTYNYTVTETGTVTGVTNDPDAGADKGKTVTIVINDDGEGHLSVGSIKSGDNTVNEENPLIFTNTMQLGKLEITKDLSVYNDFVNSTTNVTAENVTFVFEIVAVWNNQTIYKDYRSLTFADASANKISIENKLPIGTVVTIREVYDGAGYVPVGSSAPVTVTIQSATQVATAAFKNAYNNEINGGYGIENHFVQGNNGWGYDGPNVPQD